METLKIIISLFFILSIQQRIIYYFLHKLFNRLNRLNYIKN